MVSVCSGSLPIPDGEDSGVAKASSGGGRPRVLLCCVCRRVRCCKRVSGAKMAAAYQLIASGGLIFDGAFFLQVLLADHRLFLLGGIGNTLGFQLPVARTERGFRFIIIA